MGRLQILVVQLYHSDYSVMSQASDDFLRAVAEQMPRLKTLRVLLVSIEPDSGPGISRSIDFRVTPLQAFRSAPTLGLDLP